MKEVRRLDYYRNGMTKASIIAIKDITKVIQLMTKEAYKVLRETGADHIMYARKVLNDEGNIESFRTYQYLPMTNEEFENRVACLDDSIVYAIHRHD